MEPYNDFRYYYPPRPENRIPPRKLPEYEPDYLAQPKLNGASCMVFIRGEELRLFDRHHGENLSNCRLSLPDLQFLTGGNTKWNVVVGEYMNKGQLGLDGRPWNHKYVLFDILVYDGMYLTGTTFLERVMLMDSLYGTTPENDYLYRINPVVFRVQTFYHNFLLLWQEITQVGMLEGLVLKRSNARLEKGLVESTMKLHMLKCRKPTKLYDF